MNCYKCGKANADQAEFCENCGSALTEMPEKTDDTYINTASREEEESKRAKIIASAIACLFGVILLIWCISGLIGCITEGGYEKPFRVATQMFSKEKLKEKDIEKYIDVLPELKVELMEEMYEKTGKDYEDILIEQIETAKGKMESIYGKNVRMTYKILDREKLGDKELKELEDMWNNYSVDDEKLRISSAYRCCVKFGYSGKKDKAVTYSKITVCRVDGDWCFYSTDFGMFNGNIL